MKKKYDWMPSAKIINLKKRSIILSKIRNFFLERNIIEVDTPSMSQTTVTDINIKSFYTKYLNKKKICKKLFLVTSPEYHMKRLIAAGIGPIYQICHAFRNEESGRYHNPEFTMLEWYRPLYNMHQLIDEVNSLLKYILKCKNADKYSYQKIFLKFFNIDPLSARKKDLITAAQNYGMQEIKNFKKDSKDIILQIMFMLGIESYIGNEKPIFIYHFPSSQASLSKINKEDNRVSERFELFFKKIELANGFDELTDYKEQKKRFEQDNIIRKKFKLNPQKIDFYLLNALKSGMINCSGVALGIDRLIMLALNLIDINEVLSFPVNKC